jgi:L-threonylcarbamoyladenylate synthase
VIAEKEIDRAAAALRRGDVIVYPTETLYGLGVDATVPEAVKRLIALKGRAETKGISVLVGDISDAAELIDGGLMPPGARQLAEAFWPGPLTVVVPAASGVVGALLGPSGGVGLRCSPDPVCARLLAAAGRPLTSTSANPAGEPPAADAECARRYFGDRVAAYLDDGPRAGSAASTVVEFLDGSAYLRRAGALSPERISEIVPLTTEV